MSLREKAIVGALWSMFQNVGARAASFVVFFVLARLLLPEDFGLVGLGVIFLNFCQVFVRQGFSDAIIQRDEVQDLTLNTAFWANLLVGFFFFGASVLFAPAIAGLFREPDLAPIVRWLAAGFILAALTCVQASLLKRNLRFRSLAIRRIIAVVVGGVVGVWMAFAGCGVWSLVGQHLTTGLTDVVVLWRVSDWRPQLAFSWGEFKRLFSFGINMVGVQLLTWLNLEIDKLLIGVFLGPVSLGYYLVASRIVRMVKEVTNRPILLVVFSVCSRLQQQPNRVRKTFYESSSLLACVSFLLYGGLFALAPQIVLGLLGEQWAISVPILRILCGAGILQTVLSLVGTVLVAMGKPSWQLMLQACNTVGNAIAFVLALPYGIVAVAAAYVIRAYVLSPLSWWAVKRLMEIDLRVYFGAMRGPAAGVLLSSAAMYAAAAVAGPGWHDLITLAVAATIGSLVYIATIHLVQPGLILQVRDILKTARATRGGSEIDEAEV